MVTVEHRSSTALPTDQSGSSYRLSCRVIRSTSALNQQLALWSQHMASAFPSSAFGNECSSGHSEWEFTNWLNWPSRLQTSSIFEIGGAQIAGAGCIRLAIDGLHAHSRHGRPLTTTDVI